MSSPPRPHGEGLGQSAPLVSVAGVPPTVQDAKSISQQQNMTPAAENHPLAAHPPSQRPAPSQQQGEAPAVQSADMGQANEVSLSHTGASWPSRPPTNPTTSSLSGRTPSASVPPPTTVMDQPKPTQAVPSTSQPVGYSNPQPAWPPQQFSSPQGTASSYAAPLPGGAATSHIAPVQSLDDLVDSFLSGSSYRSEQQMPPLLKPPPLVNENPMQCLRTLVERRAWGDVLHFATDLLGGPDSQYTPMYNLLLISDADTVVTDNNGTISEEMARLREETTEILALKCHAWLKLRRYSDLGQEVDRWNFIPFSESYHAGQAPSWVPWSLQSLVYTSDDPNKGTDELFNLLSRMPDSDVRWKLNTYGALVNAFSRKREWRMTMVCLDSILPELETATQQELSSPTITNNNASKILLNAYRTEIVSIQGRVLLQAGAVAEASRLFQDANTDWTQCRADHGHKTEVENYRVVQHVPAQLLSNEGLLCFAYSNYDQAIECFKNATDVLRECDLSPNYNRYDWIGPSVVGVAPHAALFNECINNMALCALYSCRMRDAVSLLESLVREDPTAFLTERVAFNLCTMYELECDSTASARKKRVLQLVAKRFFLHDIGPESFRIT